ncbi:hypothetical protein CU254_41210 (plasmid) [Amycolatopsis sp. AA4]|uniref:hypothetical protein n=1 Tax=Actinomycetes TaxID=1760 RepID=UPI0001B55C2D|nr:MULTISPECIES: hypothetical protein [Actinomycetes]ATY17011.1 hypothetical protein CU254_41210 [Amycolatopsis sp. AA4]
MTTAAADALARLSSIPGVSTATALAGERASAASEGSTLPVAGPLAALGPLRRGTTVSVAGSTSLLLALLAEATTNGAWAALVGCPSVGVVAAAELGVALQRVVLVPRPGADAAAAVGALLDGLDIVVLGEALCRTVSAAAAARFSRRARNRGAVLIAAGPWPGADLGLRCEPGRWHGAAADGRGRFEYREAVIRRDGRRAPEAAVAVRLPGAGGTIAAASTAPAQAARPAMTVVAP